MTDERYLPGTFVLLSSFFAHNPWFDGDVVVIDAGLSSESRRRLEAFPKVRFQSVSAELRSRVRLLCEQVPQLAGRAARFDSLDAFLLPYETVLFLDSDVLCSGSAAGALAPDGVLLAVPDLSYWQKQMRHAETFIAFDERMWAPGVDAIRVGFNAGVLVIRPSLVSDEDRTRLLSVLDPAVWALVRTGHTDQFVLNRFFRDRWTRLPDEFNVLITASDTQFARPQPAVDDAVFLHFIGRAKPWLSDEADDDTTRRGRALARWRAAWTAYLASEFNTWSSRSS